MDRYVPESPLAQPKKGAGNESVTGRLDRVLSSLLPQGTGYGVSDTGYVSPLVRRRKIKPTGPPTAGQFRVAVMIQLLIAVVTFFAGALIDVFVLDRFATYFCWYFLTAWALAMPFNMAVYYHHTRKGQDMIHIGLYAVLMVLLHVFVLQASLTDRGVHYFKKQLKTMVHDFPLTADNPERTLRDISSTEDVLNYLTGPYADQFMCDPIGGGGENATIIPLCLINDFLYMRLTPIRIRSFRMKPNTCNDLEQFNCYGHYNAAQEDREPFVGMPLHPSIPQMNVTWTAPGYARGVDRKHVEPRTSWGHFGEYHGGGHGMVVGALPGKQAFRDSVAALFYNQFVDPSLRAMIVETYVFIGNVQTWALVRLTFESPPAGMWVVSDEIIIGSLPEPFFLRDQETAEQQGTMPGSAVEWALIAVVFVYLYSEKLDFMSLGSLRYFSDAWRIMDLIQIFLIFAAQSLRLLSTYYMPSVVTDPLMFPEYGSAAWFVKWERSLVTMSVFFVWLKLLKYLSWNHRMNVLASTLGRASRDLLVFLVLFTVVFAGYAVSFHFAFGEDVDEFADMSSSIFSLVRAMQGDIDARRLFESSRVLGLGALTAFQIMMVFILLTIVFAILNDSFDWVKREMLRHDVRMQEHSKSDLIRLLEMPGKDDEAKLDVVIWSASNVVKSDLLSKTDAYVRIELVDASTGTARDNAYETMTVPNDHSPTFNQLASIPLIVPTDHVRVSLWDKDLATKDDFLGEYTFLLSTLPAGRPLSRTVEMLSHDPLRPVAGSLKISVALKAKKFANLAPLATVDEAGEGGSDDSDEAKDGGGKWGDVTMSGGGRDAKVTPMEETTPVSTFSDDEDDDDADDAVVSIVSNAASDLSRLPDESHAHAAHAQHHPESHASMQKMEERMARMEKMLSAVVHKLDSMASHHDAAPGLVH